MQQQWTEPRPIPSEPASQQGSRHGTSLGMYLQQKSGGFHKNPAGSATTIRKEARLEEKPNKRLILLTLPIFDLKIRSQGLAISLTTKMMRFLAPAALLVAVSTAVEHGTPEGLNAKASDFFASKLRAPHASPTSHHKRVACFWYAPHLLTLILFLLPVRRQRFFRWRRSSRGEKSMKTDPQMHMLR